LIYSTWRTAFGRFAMSRPVPLRTGFDAAGLRKLARQSPAGIYAGGPARTRRGLAASERGSCATCCSVSMPRGSMSSTERRRALRAAGILFAQRSAPKRLAAPVRRTRCASSATQGSGQGGKKVLKIA
jgi:hypothetical protein